LACLPPAARGSRRNEEALVDAPARRHVDLIIALGRHDPFTATSFYGPEAWRDGVRAKPIPIAELKAHALKAEMGVLSAQLADGESGGRVDRLIREVEAYEASAHFISGGKMPLDGEAARIYDKTYAPIPESEIAAHRQQVDEALAGPGTLATRYRDYAQRTMVQVDRLKQAAQAAVAECKRRTLARFALPEDRGAVVNVADVNVPAEIQYAGGFRSTLVFRRRPFSASRLLRRGWFSPLRRKRASCARCYCPRRDLTLRTLRLWRASRQTIGS
jgi:hypothetical protein